MEVSMDDTDIKTIEIDSTNVITFESDNPILIKVYP